MYSGVDNVAVVSAFLIINLCKFIKSGQINFKIHISICTHMFVLISFSQRNSDKAPGAAKKREILGAGVLRRRQRGRGECLRGERVRHRVTESAERAIRGTPPEEDTHA